jgi:hypothetical protein
MIVIKIRIRRKYSIGKTRNISTYKRKTSEVIKTRLRRNMPLEEARDPVLTQFAQGF